MSFDFDQLRQRPDIAYFCGVAVGLGVGFMLANALRRIPKPEPSPTFPMVPTGGPCADCLEKQRAREAARRYAEMLSQDDPEPMTAVGDD